MLSGDVPLVKADLLDGAARGARARPRGDRRSCRSTRSTPPASAASSATTAARSSGSSRTRTRPDERAPAHRDQRGAVRARRVVAPAADRRPAPDRGDRRAVPHGPRRDSRARTAGSWPRSRSRTTGGSPGSTTASQLARAEWDMRVELNDRWMKAGVTMVDPSTVYLDHDVDARGRTSSSSRTWSCAARRASGSGPGSRPGRQILDSAIGERLRRLGERRSSARSSSDHVTIGPFSHLRPGRARSGPGPRSATSPSSRTARLGEHVRQHHMSYLGDAEVGADTNVGAGTITANYDGAHKHRTTIGERVFLGVDTMLGRPADAWATTPKTGAGRGRHQGRAAGQARGRRPGADARDPADPAQGAAGTRRHVGTRSRGPRRVNLPIAEILFLIVLTFSRRSSSPPRSRSSRSAAAASSSWSTRASPGRKRVQRLLSDPGRFLAVSQLGLTFIGFLASAYAAVSLAGRLAGVLVGAGMDAGTADVVALVIVTVILALFTIVFAELVPKTLALANAERFALTLVGPARLPRADPGPGRRAADRDHPWVDPADRGRRQRSRRRSRPRSCG